MGVDALLFAFNIWKARWVPFHLQGSRGLINRYYFQILEGRILAYVNCQVPFVLNNSAFVHSCYEHYILHVAYALVYFPYAVCSIAKILHSLFMIRVVSHLYRWIAVGCLMFLLLDSFRRPSKDIQSWDQYLQPEWGCCHGVAGSGGPELQVFRHNNSPFPLVPQTSCFLICISWA